jgi:hypothetical protein
MNDGNLRQSMGSAGLHRAQTEFSWDSRATALKRITHEVVTAHKG